MPEAVGPPLTEVTSTDHAVSDAGLLGNMSPALPHSQCTRLSPYDYTVRYVPLL